MKLFLVGIVLALVAWLVPWWIFGVVAALAGSFLLPHGPEMTVPYFVAALFGVACLFVGYVFSLHHPDRRKWVRPLLVAGAILLLPTIAQHAPERLNSWLTDKTGTLSLTLPADTPPEAVELIRATAPALEKHLPGLLKYQDSMSFVGVDAHYPYWSSPDSGLPEDISVTWLKFVVNRDGGSIPNNYRAWGHHLRIGIAESGKALILKKTQAKSVFLDKPFPPSGEDLVLNI